MKHVPREWAEQLEQAVLETQAYLDAIREVMAINLELLAQTSRQRQEKKNLNWRHFDFAISLAATVKYATRAAGH